MLKIKLTDCCSIEIFLSAHQSNDNEIIFPLDIKTNGIYPTTRSEIDVKTVFFLY